MVGERVFENGDSLDFGAVLKNEFELFLRGFVVDVFEEDGFEVSFSFLVEFLLLRLLYFLHPLNERTLPFPFDRRPRFVGFLRRLRFIVIDHLRSVWLWVDFGGEDLFWVFGGGLEFQF